MINLLEFLPNLVSLFSLILGGTIHLLKSLLPLFCYDFEMILKWFWKSRRGIVFHHTPVIILLNKRMNKYDMIIILLKKMSFPSVISLNSQIAWNWPKFDNSIFFSKSIFFFQNQYFFYFSPTLPFLLTFSHKNPQH